MKNKIILIFALFLTLTGFRSDEKAVKQNDTKILRSALAQIQPPRITSPLKDCKVLVNRYGRFEVSVADMNACKVTWYKDGKAISQGTNYVFSVEGNTAILVIKSVSVSDLGSYMVRVTNSAGQAQSSARLLFMEELDSL